MKKGNQKDMVNKKIVIITTIIAIIVVTGIVYFGLKIESKNQYTYSEPTVENQVDSNTDKTSDIEDGYDNNNEVKEEKNQEDKTEIEEKEEKTEEEENKKSDNETSEEEEEETEEKEQSKKPDGKDKAIELARKEWGKDDKTVYYYVEEQVSDNVYLISVRDQSTTQDLLTYKVNIKKNSVEEY